jgi:tRNA (guanine-N7-)-methyltransferase
MIEDLTHSYGIWNPPEAEVIELDLGCGKGGFLLGLAQRYPDRRIIGVDVMIGRLRKVLSKVQRAGVENASIVRCAAWPLMFCHLADDSLDRIHVLCPDPWPKARHRKKRLLGSEFLGRMSTKLKPNGILHLSTDHEPYYLDMLKAIGDMSCYDEDPDGISDIRDIKTDFELRYDSQNKPVFHQAWRVRK